MDDAAIISRSYQFAHEVADIWEQSARHPPLGNRGRHGRSSRSPRIAGALREHGFTWLRDFADLRNVVVHDRSGLPIAEPDSETVCKPTGILHELTKTNNSPQRPVGSNQLRFGWLSYCRLGPRP